MDFPNCPVSAVLNLGVPYAAVDNPKIQLKRGFNDDHSEELNGTKWQTIKAHEAVSQGIALSVVLSMLFNRGVAKPFVAGAFCFSRTNKA